MGIIAGLISMFAWGVGDFLAAVSSRKAGNVRTLFWMYVSSFVFTTVYFLLQISQYSWKQILPNVGVIMLVAIFQVVANLSFYKGLEIGTISIVSPIGASFAVITAILSVIFFREQLNLLQVVAIVMVFLGVILVSTDIKELARIKTLRVVKGVKEAVIAMIGWGLSLFFLVPASKALGPFLPVYMFRALALLLVASYMVFRREPFIRKMNTRTMVAMILIGVCDFIAFLSYSWGVGVGVASIVAPVSSAYAMVTMILAWRVFHERLVFNQYLGAGLIVAGVVAVSL